MTLELKVPPLGESITEATVSKWLKEIGDSIELDEPIVEIETDKITLEVPSPSAGTLSEIKVSEGKDVSVGGVLGIIGDKKEQKDLKNFKKENITTENNQSSKKEDKKIKDTTKSKVQLSPSVKKMIEENNLNLDHISSSRNDGRITKADIINYLDKSNETKKIKKSSKVEEIVPMSKIRKTIAKRLKEAQNTAAILTTFNEVDMSQIIKIRELKKEDFQQRYSVKLGFMSFFIKASILALKEFPAVNSEIRDDQIIYKNHYDIGIAVGSERGLVVPVLKNADDMTFGDIEKKIIEFSSKAKEGSLTVEDLSGGTFTISNGGVYGSMLSTPIINTPQSGILGMHNIIKRPVVIDDEIVIRPMMYLAFSYDHRIVDGKESVGFLIKIKQILENPTDIIMGN
tara:strand:+ start:522 stop:1721 length:1200 start_codon:yes stop_codon:yes gene_type:complete